MMTANPPLFGTLTTGLLIAFAVQLLLVNFGIAVGVTGLGYLPSGDTESASSQSSGSLSSTVRAIGFAVGFGMLLTVNSVLFIACFLAVKLSLAGNFITGAILGIVVWAAYFLILIWFGSSAVGSVVGSTLGALNLGWRSLGAIARTCFGSSSQSFDTQLQEQIAAELAALEENRRELSTASLEQIRHILEQSLQVQSLQVHQLERNENGNGRSHPQFAAAKSDAQMLWQSLLEYAGDRDAKLNSRSIQRYLKKQLKTTAADVDELRSECPPFQRNAVLAVLQTRQDLTEKQLQRACDRLEKAWNKLLEADQPAELDDSHSPDLAETAARVLKPAVNQVLKRPQAIALALAPTLQRSWGERLLEVTGLGQDTAQTLNQEALSILTKLGEGLSETVSHQILLQVEGVKSILQEQLEQLQQQTQTRVEELKQQAQHQAEIARKATATAAWWMFSIAFTSLASSAIAGALAVYCNRRW